MCNAGSDAAAIDLNMCLALLTRLTSVAHGQTDGHTDCVIGLLLRLHAVCLAINRPTIIGTSVATTRTMLAH